MPSATTATLEDALPRDIGRTSPEARALLMLAPLLLLFLQIQRSVDFIARDAPDGALIWAGAAAVLTIFLAAIARYDELDRFNARFCRAASVFLVFYFAIEPFTMPRPALDPSNPAILFHTHARWFGLALGVLGLWRPGFVAGGALVLFLLRDLNQTVTGFYFSTLDIRNVAEVVVWISVGACLLAATVRQAGLRESLGLDAPTARRLGLFILAVGIGAHLGNYFWSALAKLALDGGPTSWLTGNDMRGHILGSIEKRVLPYYFSPAVTQAVWDAMGHLTVPLQFLSFSLQAFALAAPWKRRWLMLTTVGFDLFHLGIFAMLGLFFFKWICLNAIILVALTAVRDEEWTKPVARLCIATVILGAAFFKTAMLAWYDSGNFVSPYFVAEMQDGRRLRVPSGFFASASYQVSQAQLYIPEGSRHFTSYHFGSTRHFRDFEEQERCVLPERPRPAPASFGPLDLLGRFVGQAHAIALARADAEGRFDWRWYPHHHVPWPFVAEPFEDADIRQVKRYIYVLESICQTMKGGRVERRVLLHQEWPVYEVRR